MTKELRKTNDPGTSNDALRKEITDRKQIERELRESQQRYESLVHSIDGIVWEVDAETFRFTFVSKQAERILGYPLAQWLEPSFWADHLYPDDREWVIGFCVDATQRRVDHQFEYRMIAADGRVVWLRDHVTVTVRTDQSVLLRGVMLDVTERKQAEDVLRQSEDRLRLVIDTIPTMVFTCLPDGSVDFVNQRWLQYLGLSLDDVQGWGWDFTIHPEDRARSIDHWRSTIAAGQSAENELRVRRADGEYRWILGRFVPLRDESGNIVKWYGVSTDIDDRKRAEEALRASEARLQAAIDAADIGLWEWDIHSGKVIWLGHHEKLFGFAQCEFDGTYRGFEKQVHPEDLEELNKVIQRARDEGSEYAHEYRIVWSDSTIHWIAARGRFVYNESGQPVRMYGAVLDITKRKQAEDTLRQSEDHLRLVIDTIPTMAWSLRPDGVLDYVNQRWMDYTGLSLEEAIEEPTCTVHPEDLSRAMEKWLVVMPTSEVYEDEMRLRRADGEYHWFLVRIAPLLDEQGNLLKRYGVSIDIEDRKRAEETLQYSETQLAEAQRLARVGSWDWDIRSDVVTWSDELYRIFGLQPGGIKVRGDAIPFVHPEDRDLVFSTVQTAVKNQEPYSFHYRILRPDGVQRVVHSRGHIVSDENGEPIRVFGATQDVTELKRAEEKLKATSEQLRALSARLQSAREEVATRIAREIHDELGSSLTRLKWDLELMAKEYLQAEYLQAEGDADVARLREKITAMSAIIDHTVDVVRRISAELRPSVLDDLGLAAALRLHTKQFQDRTGIVTDCECFAENLGLNQEQSTALFRVFEEALTNVMRHAGATKVDVSLKQDNGHLVLTIRDNGRGITEAEMLYPSSLGLLGMRERVNLIGGELNIAGTVGEGTLVTVRFPSSE